MRTSFLFPFVILAAVVLHTTELSAQAKFLKGFLLSDSSFATLQLPPSNSVSHMVTKDSTLWIGTGKGLARTVNGGRSWQSFRSNSAFANDGIFAVSVHDSLVWASTGFVKKVDESWIQTGSGYAKSSDAGRTWEHSAQPLDGRGDSIFTPPYGVNDSIWILPIVVPEQNVTFDISIYGTTVWIASWSSGLRKSTDYGQSWQRVLLPLDHMNSIAPTDTLWTYAPNDTNRLRRIFPRFDPRCPPCNNNLLAFAVLAVDDSTIWCGTAGGVNKSTNGGRSWIRFTRRNQVAPILSNWVIAIEQQQFQNRIWTTNWKTLLLEEVGEEHGVSYTEDGGLSWRNLLRGIKAYDFAFKDSIVYIATDDGLYRTDDGGLTFLRSGTIIDQTTRQMITTSAFYSVAVVGDTVWGGTPDGLVSTIDNVQNPFGSSWKIHRTYQSTALLKSTYAYPNPFSPNFEITRLHYPVSTPATVTAEIFDFGMNYVRTVVRNAGRIPGEYDEIWNGLDDEGRQVSNGVYFYRIIVGNDEPLWGKVLVLK